MKLKIPALAFHTDRKKYLDQLKRGKVNCLVITAHGKPMFVIRRATMRDLK